MGWEAAGLRGRLRRLALVSSFVVLSAGYAAALTAAGALGAVGISEYLGGELSYSHETDFYRAYVSTLGALEDLAFPVTEEWVDGFEARIVARKLDRTPIRITLEQTSERVTQIRIRVGSFGDESLSEHIARRIRARL